MNKRIEITVDPQGNTLVETKGIVGAECVGATKFIEQALGKQTEARTTPEFFHVHAEQQQQASNGS